MARSPRKFQNKLNDFNVATDNVIKELKRTSRVNAVFRHVAVCKISEDHNNTILTASFDNLSYRAESRRQSSGKNISVAIVGQLADRGDQALITTSELTGYGTQITYWKEDPEDLNESEALTGFHFDFRSNDACEIQPAHPVFHAQHEPLAAEKWYQYHDKEFVPKAQPRNVIRTIRIPTPQMDIFSCVVMVIADHLVGNGAEANSIFKKYIDKLRADSLIPKVNLECYEGLDLQGCETREWYLPSLLCAV